MYQLTHTSSRLGGYLQRFAIHRVLALSSLRVPFFNFSSRISISKTGTQIKSQFSMKIEPKKGVSSFLQSRLNTIFFTLVLVSLTDLRFSSFHFFCFNSSGVCSSRYKQLLFQHHSCLRVCFCLCECVFVGSNMFSLRFAFIREQV